MFSLRAKLTTLAAVGAATVAGAAIASAASSTTPTTGTAAPSPQAQYLAPPGGGAPPAQRNPSLGGHQANGKTEVLLTGDTASKVEAAARAKVPGGTIERVETDVDTGSPYEAHVRKSDGSEVIVYVDASFNATGTGTMGHP